jgi:hypothetical protein
MGPVVQLERLSAFCVGLHQLRLLSILSVRVKGQLISAGVKKKLDELLNSPPEKSRVILMSAEVQTELDKLENSPLVRKELDNPENIPLPE